MLERWMVFIASLKSLETSIAVELNVSGTDARIECMTYMERLLKILNSNGLWGISNERNQYAMVYCSFKTRHVLHGGLDPS